MKKSDEIEKRLNNPGGGNITLGEFLHKIATLQKADKQRLLRIFTDKSTGNFKALTVFVHAMWNPKTTMTLPEGAPPYKKGEYADWASAPSTLQREMNKLAYFMKASPQFITNNIKREQVFIQMLESLYSVDADVILSIKDRSGIKGITAEMIFAEYPESFPWLSDVIGDQSKKSEVAQPAG